MTAMAMAYSLDDNENDGVAADITGSSCLELDSVLRDDQVDHAGG